MEQPSFLKNHIDTLAIIAVNVAIAAILVTMIISNSHRIDAVNTRADNLYSVCIQMQQDIKNLYIERWDKK